MQPSRLSLICLLALAATRFAQPRLIVQHVQSPYTPADSGEKMFGAYCASCHGVNGRGNGPASSALKEKPADLTQLARRHNGVFPSEWVARVIEQGPIAANGSSEMPVWGPELSRLSAHDEQIRLLRVHNLVS